MRLPLFPLDLVLFPGGLIPLHIFEPRYRTLLADCLAGEGRFGIVLPGPDGGLPSTGVIGTVAEIRATHPLPDGRSTIVVEGTGRFMVRRWLEEGTPYPLAMVDPFEDDPEDAETALAEVPELRRLADRQAAALRTLTDGSGLRPWPADPGGLSFAVAGLLDVDLTFKQRFLGTRSASHRVELLLRILPGIVTDLEARAAVKRRATTNGHGGSHPDIILES